MVDSSEINNELIRKYVDELDRLEVPSHPPVDVFVVDDPINPKAGVHLGNVSAEIIDIDEYLEERSSGGAYSRKNGPDPVIPQQDPKKKDPLEPSLEDGIMRIAIPEQDLTKYIGVEDSDHGRFGSVETETLVVETVQYTPEASATKVQDEVEETVLALPEPAVTKGKEYSTNDLQDWEVVSLSEASPEAIFKKRILYVVVGTMLVAAVITLVSLLI
jgi:hypothetical protein